MVVGSNPAGGAMNYQVVEPIWYDDLFIPFEKPATRTIRAQHQGCHFFFATPVSLRT